MNIIGVNAKLGDGCLQKSSETSNARAAFTGKDISWISFKRDLAIKEGFEVSQLVSAYSGYKKNMSMVRFSTKTDVRLTYVANTNTVDVLDSLNKKDLIMWYLDDGSWHKTRKTMHLYCNMLNDKELCSLMTRIYFMYGIEPRRRVDRKKDGRVYPYLYFPRLLVERFKKDVQAFLIENQLESLYYKIGETSETIRNGVGFSESEKGSNES
jgi:hypothetical protein